jgi:ATP-dependent Lhr-like helicase
LVALEVEGFAFQGRFSPPTAAEGEAVEWCERHLLQRIHRYSIDAHRKSIAPVSLQTYTEFLFDRHQLLSLSEEEQSASPSLDGQTQLQNTLSLLDGIPAPAASWEADLYPVRIKDYDPSWLDVMCISGKVAWGRYTLPAASLRESKSNSRKSPGPIKTTPITLVLRQNLDIWQALASSQLPQETQLQYSASARRIESDLEQHGASFFDQIQSRTSLLKTLLEEGLAELVAGGRLNSDSFTGLRALLTPSGRRRGNHRRRGRKSMFGVEDAGRWSLLDTFMQATTPAEQASRYWKVLDEEQLQRLASIYLRRWGVLFRNLLDRESKAPPWRVLLATLRKMELRGSIRGGRFISGVSGEQFAFSETVDDLRQFSKGQEKRADLTWVCIAATDPLNLINLSLPNRKLPRLGKNRVLYRNGIAVAVLESGDVHFLTEVEPDQRWLLQQLLLKRSFQPRLRSYLGNR